MTVRRSRMSSFSIDNISMDMAAVQLTFPVHRSRRYGPYGLRSSSERAARRASRRNSPPVDSSCFICEDVEFDVVLSQCCHYFCWPCLYTWLHCYSSPQRCPWCNRLLGDDYEVTRASVYGYREPDRRSRPFLAEDIPIRPTDQVPPRCALLEEAVVA